MTMGCTGRTCGSIKMWDAAGASFTMAVNVLEWGSYDHTAVIVVFYAGYCYNRAQCR